MNRQTRNQLTAIILIDCLQQLNKLALSRDEYELRLKAMLRERLFGHGQTEMPI